MASMPPPEDSFAGAPQRSALPAEVEALLFDARKRPDDLEQWAKLEASAQKHERTGDVAEAYRDTIRARPDLAVVLGRRAVEFHDDWGEEPAHVSELVESIFAAAPTEAWALDRLKLTYGSEERWGDLLLLFDRALEATIDREGRAALLEDAGRVARDFARDYEKAALYQEKLYAIRGDKKTRAQLEKLYERCGKNEQLVELYAAQLPYAEPKDAQALRAKIAQLYLAIDDRDAAFSMIETMLGFDAGDPQAFELLERIFAAPSRTIAPPPPPPSSTRAGAPASEPAPASVASGAGNGARSVRQRAAMLLKPRYAAEGRSRDLVRVLEVELSGVAAEGERAAIYRELYGLQRGSDDAGAFEALAQLVVLEPAEGAHRAAMETLSKAIDREERRAKILASAAERVTDAPLGAVLLVEAAEVWERSLSTPARAIDLYRRALDHTSVEPEVALKAARSLQKLLGEAGRLAEQCEVLERLAKLEPDGSARRAVLGEVARIASKDFGDTERAIRAWRTRLDDDATDLDAIAGLRSALASQGRWRELLGVLERGAAALPDARTALLLEAAQLCERELDDATAAARCYEELLIYAPDDARAMDRLAAVYRTQGKRIPLLALRKRQIAQTGEPRERVRLRLEAAQVLEELGETAERVAMLEQALLDDPRERATAAALASGLEALGRHAELATLWESQALARADAGEILEASDLYRRAAEIAERKLEDLDRAVRDHERAGDHPESLDALATLHAKRGEPDRAASVLERLLGRVSEEERPAVALRLAAALVASQRRERARACLEQASRDRDDPRLRAALADLYRADEAWGPLATLLSEEAGRASDDAAKLSYLRQAAELHLEKRSDPAAAVPLLEEAKRIAGADVGVNLALAAALLDVGRKDEAADLLKKRIDEFGTRRPKERALVHHGLAKVLLDRGDRTEALAELDFAVKIDPVNLATRRAYADVAAECGELETAQRTYRAILLVAPRADAASPGAILRSEVLLALADVAERLGDPSEASEHVEAALAIARESDAERVATQKKLLASGRHAELAALYAEQAESSDPDRAAAACDQLAQLYEEKLSRPAEGLAMRLRAVSLTPTSAPRHAIALTTARAQGRVDGYVKLLEDLCEKTKEPEVAFDLFATLGDSLLDEGRLEEAARALEGAERVALTLEPHDAGGRRLDRVWRSLDKVYTVLGDDEARAPVLARLAHAAEARGEPAAEQATLLYALAKLQLGKTATIEAGLDTIERARALDEQPDAAEVGLLFAIKLEPTNERALWLYESVSRAPGRESSRIDALRRLGKLKGSRRCLREAAELAHAFGDRPGAEALLRRYIDLLRVDAADRPAAESPELGDAMLALAALRREAGDVREVATLSEEAAAYLDHDRARATLLEVAKLAAGPLADLPRAAKIYGALRAEAPNERSIWEPLAEVLRALGDAGALASLLEEVIPEVDLASDRVRLRLELASLLSRAGTAVGTRKPPPSSPELDDDGWGAVAGVVWPRQSNRPPPPSGSVPPPAGTPATSASRVLWQVLEDDPTNAEATAALTQLLERSARHDELASLLSRQIDIEKDRQDGPAVAALSTRLGDVLEQAARDEDALAAYRVAIEWDPTNKNAHRALMRLSEKRQDPAELAEALETMLELEVGTEAERIALRLAALGERLEDPQLVERALSAGIERCPHSDALRERLAQTYEKASKWRELAMLYARVADTRATAVERVAELRLAADILRRTLADSAAAAVILDRAAKALPEDRALTLELIETLADAGNTARARELLDEAVAAGHDAGLLHARAKLHEAGGDLPSALADLESAYELTDGGYAESLVALLLRRIEELGGDAVAPEDELPLRMRLAEVLYGMRRDEEACVELTRVLELDPMHHGALSALAVLHADAERPEESIACYEKLLQLEQGEELVDTTLAFAQVCEAHGLLDKLRPALEAAHRLAPEDREVRKRLSALYTSIGDRAALAELLLADAETADDQMTRFATLIEAARLLVDPFAGDAERAIEVLAQAREIKPDDPEAGMLHADALSAMGHKSQALDLLEELVSVQKRRSRLRSQMHRRIAVFYAQTGARAAALQSLMRALDDDPHDAVLAMEVGLAAAEANDLEATSRAFRTLTLMKTAAPGSNEGATPQAKGLAYYHLALVAQRQGDVRKARVMIEKSLQEHASADAKALADVLKRAPA